MGDGHCNDETNHLYCNYDGGDCCLLNITSDYCSECSCHYKETCASGIMPSIVGDNFCNDETNIVECNYDGGDCCLSSIIKDRCLQCNCFLHENCAIWVHPSVGDGVCNDETNIEECDYDGHDCCKSPVNKDHCLSCTCIGKFKHL